MHYYYYCIQIILIKINNNPLYNSLTYKTFKQNTFLYFICNVFTSLVYIHMQTYRLS